MNQNPFSIEDKTILVTGASSGIGRAIAVECSKMGASVVITGRNKERLEQTLSQMEGEGHLAIDANLTSGEDRLKLVNEIPCTLDGIVQCAGMAMPKPFQFYSEEDVAKIMDINFNAPLSLTQSLIKKKKIAKDGSLVFISSISGVMVGYIGGSIYSASKGAINGMVKGLALELAPKNIRVNCVVPGMIDTSILSEGVVTQEQLEEDAKKYPLRRYGKPEEVAYAVIYLLSDASRWTTGSNLLIDGGYTLL